MITFEEALEAVLRHTRVLSAENIALEDSIRRILGEDIYSGIEMPPFDKAAMDGYAVNASNIKTNPSVLWCIGTIQAGEAFKGEIKPGECVKIMTGAPLPKNTDSVIMVEDTKQDGERIELLKPVKQGDNVCLKGEDLQKKQRVLGKGTQILSSSIAIIATVGRKLVKVFGKPTVAVLNTGGEIVPLGGRLSKNKIYNSNGPMLCTLLKSDGIKPCYLGIAKDNMKDLSAAVKKGLKADILLISGGVSAGDYDLIPDVLEKLGVKKIFHKVNIKPGKPLFFGAQKNKIIFGIPGNPVSNFLTYLLFTRPALYKMMGFKDYKPIFKEGIIEEEFHSKSGRKHFVLAKIAKENEHYKIIPVSSHGSADTLALAQSDAFMIVGEDISFIEKGSKAQFVTWKAM